MEAGTQGDWDMRDLGNKGTKTLKGKETGDTGTVLPENKETW